MSLSSGYESGILSLDFVSDPFPSPKCLPWPLLSCTILKSYCLICKAGNFTRKGLHLMWRVGKREAGVANFLHKICVIPETMAKHLMRSCNLLLLSPALRRCMELRQSHHPQGYDPNRTRQPKQRNDHHRRRNPGFLHISLAHSLAGGEEGGRGVGRKGSGRRGMQKVGEEGERPLGPRLEPEGELGEEAGPPRCRRSRVRNRPSLKSIVEVHRRPRS